MITLRQMEQLTGVSRRMLQDYNKIGLLKYRGKTPGGYWLYDEADADRLAAIQLLRSYGFTRKEVLLLLGDPDQPVSDVMPCRNGAAGAAGQHRSGADSAAEDPAGRGGVNVLEPVQADRTPTLAVFPYICYTDFRFF